jgi:hypothetical protein
MVLHEAAGCWKDRWMGMMGCSGMFVDATNWCESRVGWREGSIRAAHGGGLHPPGSGGH